MTLKEILRAKGMSQIALARLSGIKYANINRWLNGYASPTQDNYDKLIEVLGEVPSDITVETRGTD